MLTVGRDPQRFMLYQGQGPSLMDWTQCLELSFSRTTENTTTLKPLEIIKLLKSRWKCRPKFRFWIFILLLLYFDFLMWYFIEFCIAPTSVTSFQTIIANSKYVVFCVLCIMLEQSISDWLNWFNWLYLWQLVAFYWVSVGTSCIILQWSLCTKQNI